MSGRPCLVLPIEQEGATVDLPFVPRISIREITMLAAEDLSTPIAEDRFVQNLAMNLVRVAGHVADLNVFHSAEHDSRARRKG